MEWVDLFATRTHTKYRIRTLTHFTVVVASAHEEEEGSTCWKVR